jgi:phage terminase small subunit
LYFHGLDENIENWRHVSQQLFTKNVLGNRDRIHLAIYLFIHSKYLWGNYYM